MGAILLRAVQSGKKTALKAVLPLSVAIAIVGISPLAARVFVQTRQVYHVRVTVLGSDHLPVSDADVTSSCGGEPKAVKGGWEFDIPPQAKPSDDQLTLFASESSSFLSGQANLALTDDYFPAVTIQLVPDKSAWVRGTVVDERGRAVAGADVSVSGYQDLSVTDNMGNFTLSAHAADGQIVTVRAQKGRRSGSLSVPAGNVPIQLVVMRH